MVMKASGGLVVKGTAVPALYYYWQTAQLGVDGTLLDEWRIPTGFLLVTGSAERVL